MNYSCRHRLPILIIPKVIMSSGLAQIEHIKFYGM